MKIFISQRTKGLPQEEILAARKLVAVTYEEEGHEVLNKEPASKCARDLTPYKDLPFSKEIKEQERKSREDLYELGGVLSLVAEADCVHFMPGWSEDKECKLVRLVCKQYGISALDPGLWLKGYCFAS